MKIILAILTALIFSCSIPLRADSLATNAPARVRLTLLGDSMMAVQAESRGPQGWGTYLDKYLPNVQVTDLASSGRSSKSFMLGDMQADGTIKPPLKWPQVLATPADYWLISFGGNDLKPGFRYTDPTGSYTADLTIYIDEARKRGITPVLITPTHHVAPRDGSPEPLAPYAEAVRQLAKKENVPLMDLYDFTTQWYVKEGTNVVKYQPPEYGGHFNHVGAEIFAAEMARQFSRIEPRAGQPRPVVGSP
jgi:lysophospholipase L1-like esterase